MIVVTTFPDLAWDLYARTFMETYCEFWTYPLHVFIDQKPDFDHPLVTYHEDFSSHPDVAYFRADAPGNKDDYRKNAKQWVFKVIAQCEGIKIDPRMVWLDADVVTFDKPDTEWLERTCTQYPITCLSRNGWHSETGFIMYNALFPAVKDFFVSFREAYSKKRIYGLKGWTDCHVFDDLRKGIECHNLSPWGHGAQHVWPASKLGEWMDHLKGQRKFLGESPERISF